VASKDSQTNTMHCPICHQHHQTLVHHFNGAADDSILKQLQTESPHWQPDSGACTRCIDQAQIEFWSTQQALSPHTSIDGYKILPIPQRLAAHPDYSGKGITICFIDSGFYPHPDIKNRILCIEDLSASNTSSVTVPNSNSWHGTMTAVVGTGDGTSSNGVYQSLAASAKLVLLKVADQEGKISGENIAKAIHWAIDHRKKFAIRILNLSVTDDWATSYRVNIVDQAIQKATDAGIVVVVAAGNDEHALVKAPANSPHAITIGGLNDHNTLHPIHQSWYPSTFGTTVDGLQKPDLIAPAIWIPAPILPLTKAHEQARLLFSLAQTQDSRYLKAKYINTAKQFGFESSLVFSNDEGIRQKLQTEIGQRKLITPDYQHADGTSFAAPIVSGIVAQMLEANPNLTPQKVKEVLGKTARTLPNVPSERQGAGVVHALNAVKAVKNVVQPKSPIFFF
jgi:serine protease AprX